VERSEGRVNEPLKLPSCKNSGHRQMRHSIKEREGDENLPCEACDCTNYETVAPLLAEYDPTKDPMNDPSSPQFIERKLYPRVKEWAHSYNGYERFASEQWADLLEPLFAKFQDKGEIPSWVGVDLLRASAFFMARSHNWACMNETYYPCHSVIYALADAVQNHEAATKNDLPPHIPESLREFGRRS